MVTEEHVGGQRWRSMGRWPQQTKEEAGSALQRFLVEDTGSAASLAWLRGTRERCVVVRAWRLEQRRMARGRAKWVGARWLLQEVERTGFSFKPTARGDDARGSGYMRCVWSGCGGRSTAPTRGGGSGPVAVTRARRQRLGAV
jgi:hypothetical protein